MATLVGTEMTLQDLLKDLVRLDFDAAAAYQAAIDRLRKPAFKAAMRRFKADHLRHTRELSAYLRAMGHRPPRDGDMMQVLTTGKVVIAGLAGDTAILTAMRTNEDDTVTAYDRAVSHPDCPADAVRLLQRGDRDEHRHRAWIVSALEGGTSKRTRRPAPKRRGAAHRKTGAARRKGKPTPSLGTRAKSAPKRRASR